jgi:hypothetical protein
LVVVVAQGGQMTQKVVETHEQIRPADLIQATNYLNSEFAGLPVLQVRAAVLARLQQERVLYDQLRMRALRLAQSTLESLPRQQTFHVEGAASLLDDAVPESMPVATMRALLETPGPAAESVHRQSGRHRHHRYRTRRTRPSRIQPRRLDRRRRQRHPDGGRNRADAHALFAHHHAGGWRHASGLARTARTEPELDRERSVDCR